MKAHPVVRLQEVALAVCAAGAIALAFVFGADALGATASVVAFLLFIPQAAVVWRSRHSPEAMSVVSLGTQVLILTNAVIWALYGWETRAFWVAAPGIVNGPLAVTVTAFVIRSRMRVRAAHEQA